MIECIAYNAVEKILRRDIPLTQVIQRREDPDWYFWLDIMDLTPDEAKMLVEDFHLDALAVEDCLHARQTPKLESFHNYHFFIVHGVHLDASKQHYHPVELDGFLGERLLITIHDVTMSVIEVIKHRAEQGQCRLIQGTTALAYEVLDGAIDTYLPALDDLDRRIEALEESIQNYASDAFLSAQYFDLMKGVLLLRRLSMRNQEVFYEFSHSDMAFIDSEQARRFRDIYDHVVRVVDITAYYQQALQGAMQIQYSINASRVNTVVQFLTVLATIMLPLNVITGVYGMNFDFMPFLHHPWGFWLTIWVMIGIVAGMLVLFRKRRWI
jgi:magnesium transporter